MNPAPYPPNNTEELQAVVTFLGLLDLSRVKPAPNWLDKVPNSDGQIEIVDEEQRCLGKLEVQIKKNSRWIDIIPVPDSANRIQ